MPGLADRVRSCPSCGITPAAALTWPRHGIAIGCMIRLVPGCPAGRGPAEFFGVSNAMDDPIRSGPGPDRRLMLAAIIGLVIVGLGYAYFDDLSELVQSVIAGKHGHA